MANNEDPIFNDSNSRNAVNANDVYVIEFFGIKIRRKYKNIKPDLDPLDIVRRLLEDFESPENIEKSKSVANLHRLIENTHARRRLEKWSLRTIGVYLCIVCFIVFATYAHIPFIGFPFLHIEPQIMVAILTTTTANIIGLGLIVLRGHFLARDDDKSKSKNKD